MNSVRYGKSIPIELRIGSEGKSANFSDETCPYKTIARGSSLSY